MGKRERGRLTGWDGRFVVEVAPTVVPSIAVVLDKRVVIVGRGIELLQKIGFVHGAWWRRRLGKEVVTIVGIGVACAAKCRGIIPRNRPFGIEKMATSHHTLRHFVQVIACNEVGFAQHFVLQPTAITIDMHLIYIGEPCLTDERFAELMHARLGYFDLHPAPLCQHRLMGIAVGSGHTGGQRIALSVGKHTRLRRDAQHEPRQSTITPIAIGVGKERNHQHRLLALHHHRLLNRGPCGWQRRGYRPISLLLCWRKGRKLGVNHLHLVGGIAVVTRQRHGIREARQCRIDV